MPVTVENPPIRSIGGHVPWTRTQRGTDAIAALGSENGDPELRAWLVQEYRAKIPQSKGMTDEQIVDHYLRFLMSCPIKCPHCHPEAAS